MIEIAKDLTLALIKIGDMPPEDMQATLEKTYATLTALKAQEASGTFPTVPVAQTPPADWRKSITKHTVTCLACGQAFKQLSLRHLRAHGLDNRSYRTQYGIPPTQPLVARATTERRRQVVQAIRPWEKKQQLLQARGSNGHASPAPEGEAVPEAAEEPGTAAPAQPKCQRKTSAKKNRTPDESRRVMAAQEQ
jgi:predicted transcriptional regulator